MDSDPPKDARCQVLDLLRNEKTKELLAEQYDRIHVEVEDFRESEHDFAEELNVDGGEIHPATSEAFDAAAKCAEWDEQICDLLQDRVVDPLGPPHIITIGDLNGEFWRHMRVPVNEFDSAYQVFLWNIENIYLRERSLRAFAIGELIQETGRPDSTEKQDKSSDDGIFPWSDSKVEPQIWSKNGIVLKPIGVSLAELDSEQQVRSEAQNPSQLLYVKLTGHISESASLHLRNQMVQILPSIIRTMSLMANESGRVWRWTLLPQLTFDMLQAHRYFISKCLESYFSTPPKKARFERCVQNAIQLLADADTQWRHSIAIALTVTAIEALLGKKGTDIAKTISENVTFLLEPEFEHRLKAEDFVKKLYDTRSRVLHGDDVGGTPTTRNDARLLASAVMFAIEQKRDFTFRRDGEPAKLEHLFEELREQKYKSGLIEGVRELPVRHLWKGE